MFKLPTEERLAEWRRFRSDLDSKPLEKALELTAILWSRAPFSPYYLDLKDHENWPDPWTLISDNYYCDIAKCLAIIYTIALTDHHRDLSIEMRIYQDHSTRHQYNLAWIDQGKYILNMTDGEILNSKQFNETHKLIRIFPQEDLKLEDL